MNTQVQGEFVRDAPFIAGVVVKFVRPNVGRSRKKEIPNRAAWVTEQHTGNRVAAAARAHRVIGKSGRECEPAERALPRRAGGFTDESLADIDSELPPMLAFLPTDVRYIFEHMLAPDQRFRSRIAQTDIGRRTDNRRGRLEWIARVASRYLRPYRIR